MFFWDPISLIAVVAIVVLAIVAWRQQQRLRILEFDLEGLRTAFLAHREKVAAGGFQAAGSAEAPALAAEPIIVPPSIAASDIAAATISDAAATPPPPQPEPAEQAGEAGPWTEAEAARQPYR